MNLTAGRVSDDRFVPYVAFDYLKNEKGKVDFKPVKGDLIIVGNEECFRPHQDVVLDYPSAVNNSSASWQTEMLFEMHPSFAIIIAAKALSFLDHCRVPKALIGQAKDGIGRLNEQNEIVAHKAR